MAKKNGIIFNFTVNGFPVISKDENDKWHPFQKSDDHFEDDPRNIFHKDEDAQDLKLTELAKTLNKSVDGVTELLAEALKPKSDEETK